MTAEPKPQPRECTPGYAERCYNSEGKVCKCRCKGDNHGIQFRMEIEAECSGEISGGRLAKGRGAGSGKGRVLEDTGA